MNQNFKKVTLGLLSTTLLVGGVASMATKVHAKEKTANVKLQKDYEMNKAFYDKGIINSFKAEHAQVGDNNISYLIRNGSEHPQKTYVLAHGATATKNIMKVFAAELAKKEPNNRIILVDLPLHGESTGTMGDLSKVTVHDYANVMYDFLNQKTQDGTIQGTVNWTGWSMGGSIGMLLDLKGANIDELTLLDSSPYWGDFVNPVLSITNEDNVNDIMNSAYEDDLQTHISTIEREDILGHLNALLTSSPSVMVQDFKAIAPENYDIRAQLKDIKAKTLIIGGTLDSAAFPQYQSLMDETIHESKSIIYEDSHPQLIKPAQAKLIVSELHTYFN